MHITQPIVSTTGIHVKHVDLPISTVKPAAGPFVLLFASTASVETVIKHVKIVANVLNTAYSAVL